jgi:hypothetical protein
MICKIIEWCRKHPQKYWKYFLDQHARATEFSLKKGGTISI